jgi:protein TonB
MSAEEALLGGTRPRLREVALWGGAAVAAILAHLGVVAVLYAAVPDDDGYEAVEEAMVVDLAPLPIATPEAVAADMLQQDSAAEALEPVDDVVEVAEVDLIEVLPAEDVVTEEVPESVVEPEVVEAEPVEQEVVEQETVEPESVEAEPVEVAAVETPVVTQEVVEPEIVETQVFEAITPEVVIPLPQPRPEKPVERKKPQRPREVAQKETPKEETRPAPKKQVREAKAKPSSDSPAFQASHASTAPRINPAKWHNQVRAAIVRRISRVRGMRGTVKVSFVVSRSGSIVSASVAGPSGDGALDNAALRMVRQAQVPPPPAGLDGEQHSFTVPLTFK